MSENFYRDRFLIDYCQHVTFNLLYRSDGAPFLGEGEKYFSIIDDTEIEIMKCLWEGPDVYRNLPPPRRLWNIEFPELGVKTKFGENKSYYSPEYCYADLFIELTKNTVEVASIIEKNRDVANALVFNRLERGVLFLMLVRLKDWDSVYFLQYFPKSMNALKNYLIRFPKYSHYLNKIHLLESGSLSNITKPFIRINNLSRRKFKGVLFKNKDYGIEISYCGRI